MSVAHCNAPYFKTYEKALNKSLTAQQESSLHCIPWQRLHYKIGGTRSPNSRKGKTLPFLRWGMLLLCRSVRFGHRNRKKKLVDHASKTQQQEQDSLNNWIQNSAWTSTCSVFSVTIYSLPSMGLSLISVRALFTKTIIRHAAQTTWGQHAWSWAYRRHSLPKDYGFICFSTCLLKFHIHSWFSFSNLCIFSLWQVLRKLSRWLAKCHI